jgi:integrating conjugative element protein (TIGR03765 family)
VRCPHPARITLLGIGFLANAAFADLTVIYDSGATQPLAPLLEAFAEIPPAAPSTAPPMGQIGAADPARLLPIRTPELTPGNVTPRPLQLPNGVALPRPFFLLGADRRSREWFAAHRDRLEAIGAIGMLVDAATTSDLEAIAALARGLPILPASASDIAQSLGLDHIPVLISRQGIEQ